MKLEDIRKVLVVGAGTMGQQIALQVSLYGFDVCLYDIQKDILNNARRRIKDLGQKLIQDRKWTNKQIEQALGRIKFTTDPEEAAYNADFLSESVPEDPDLKSKVFAQFNELCKDEAIFTTNTSSLIPSMLAHKTGRADRFAALHFHDIRITRIVDVMPHPGTSKETLALIVDFAKAIGQDPIVLRKENHGYVFNAMLMEWLKSALTLAANGVATIEDIDKAWMGVMNSPIGPFTIMDSIGLDTVWKITDYWAKKTNDPQAKKNALFLKSYVDQGKLGIKSGEGFYFYNS